MQQTVVYKDKLARFGRALALLLNRSLMYQASHPFIKQSVAEVFAVGTPLLASISPLVFILNRGQFFVDEELLDPRLNVNRTAALFKSSGLQSVSFEKGLLESELIIFAELFTGLTKMSTAESMKEKLIRRGVFNIKINHVVFKKVTEDDQVVSRDALKKITPLLNSDDQQQRKQFMETLLESVLTEEFAKTLNITNLMADPTALTRKMIQADLTGAMQPAHEGQGQTAGNSGAKSGTHAIPRTEDGTTAETDAAVEPPGTGSGGLAGVQSEPGRDDTGGPPPMHNTAAPIASAAAAGEVDAVAGQAQRPADIDRQGPLAGSGGNPSRTPARDGAGNDSGAAAGAAPGTLLLHQIKVMQQEVEKHLQSHGETSLADLAQSIFEMKKQLLEGIQAQKALGTAYANEAAILKAADKLTDQVMLELIREEYQAGAVTPRRLAQLIVRIIPEADELRRLLPQIKRALLQEGMPPADYLNLIHALRDELQSDELARILQESSESIGLDGEMLIEEVKRNPSQAGELIYLASQIRQSGGDETALSDILVDYVEQLGDRMAKDAVGDGSPDGAAHLEQVMTDVESTLLKKLGQMNLNTNLLKQMEDRINVRMESILDNIRVQWLHHQTGGGAREEPKPLSVLQTLEHHVGDDEELSAILQSVRVKVEAGEIEENDFSCIHEEIVRLKSSKGADRDDQSLPEDVLTSEEIMFILEKEIARAKRYGSPFSALAFAFVTAKPQMKSLGGLVTNKAVLQAALEQLAGTFRSGDYIGRIGKNKMLVLLPMTQPAEGKQALSRVLRLLHQHPLEVRGVPVQLRVAGVVAGYDAEQVTDAGAFAKHLSDQLTDMVARIKNIQVLF